MSSDGPPPLATYAYEAVGRRIGKTMENGVATTYGYDAASQLLSINHQHSTNTFASFTYTYDQTGNRLSKLSTINAQPSTETYQYDPTDQLSQVSYGSTRTTAFNYDPVGNRSSVTDSAGIVPASYQVNSANQYTNVGGAALTYDPNGNLTSYDGRTFTYDAENKLLSATSNSSSVVTKYDARRRAVARTTTINNQPSTTYFTWDGWSLIGERDGVGTQLARYVHGDRIDEILARIDATEPVYFHHDALGSTVALTDAAGTQVESYSYDVFGAATICDPTTSAPRTSSAFANRFLFTGREWIAAEELYDYRHRAYSAKLGRFLQTDPIRFDAGDANIYRYVVNSPVQWTDPTGEGFWRGLLDYLNKPKKPGPGADDALQFITAAMAADLAGECTAANARYIECMKDQLEDDDCCKGEHDEKVAICGLAQRALDALRNKGP